MKTLDAAFLSALILTLLILIHVATAATDNPLQNTHLTSPTNSTSTETPTKAVQSRGKEEKNRNSTTEAPPLQGNDSSTTLSAVNVTLSSSSSVLQPTAPDSTALTVPQAKTPTILSASVSPSAYVSPSASVVPSTGAGSAGELKGGSIAIVLLSVILLLILILVAAFKWASRPSNQNSPASHLILGLGPRVRGGVRTLEDRLGFSLCPGGRGERDINEEEGEEEEEKVNGKMTEVVVGVGGEGGKQKDEEEEDEDSSDDYSSMEGNNLRQRAQSGEEEQKTEDKAKSEGGQEQEKKGNDREREGCEEAIALISPGSEKSGGEIEESDVTIL